MISLVLGLGNVGRKYVGTRHNVGFEVVSRLADRLNATPQPRRPEYDWSTAKVGGIADNCGRQSERALVLAWPRTYMNLSGEAGRILLTELGMGPSELLVVVDDFNLPLGAIRTRSRGSDGGHNGLMSLIDELGTEEFARLRIGVGPVPRSKDIVDFVLGAFSLDERQRIDPVLATAADAVFFAIEHRLEEMMSKYNMNPAPPESA